jgi:hypothetical protein
MSTMETLSPSANGSPAGKSEHPAPATGVPLVVGGCVPASVLPTVPGDVVASDPGTVEVAPGVDIEPKRSPKPVPPAADTPAATPAIKATSSPATARDSFIPLDQLPLPIRK